MSWAFVRPADPRILAGRPLLDLGTGDGATVRSLAPDGTVVGLDRNVRLLRRGSVSGEAVALPFLDGSFATVLAADLLHHLPDTGLTAALAEVRRVLRTGATFVAWWYERTDDRSPDAPRHCRDYDAVAGAARLAGLEPRPLELVTAVGTSPTVGLVAT